MTTSGTAAANLHPAVLEAAHAGVTLVAGHGRPPRAAARYRRQPDHRPGPPLRRRRLLRRPRPPRPRRPRRRLAPRRPDPPERPARRPADPRSDSPWQSRRLRPAVSRARTTWSIGMPSQCCSPLGKRTVVVAGDDAGPPARQLAERAGWPLLAEPSSGSRTGTHPIRTYRLLLGTDAGRADRAGRRLRAPHPVAAGAAAARARGRRGGLGRPRPVAGRRGRSRSTPSTPPYAAEAGRSRLARGVAYGGPGAVRAHRRVRRATSPSSRRTTSRPVVDAANPPGGLLVVGASNPIRDLDLMAGAHPVGERRFVLANRGLAGIDGTVSTAIGAALGRPRSSRAIAYVGDVTFLHDADGALPRPRRAAPGPDRRGGQRRRRLDLRDPGAGGARARRPRSSGSSARRTTSTWPACAPPAGPRTGGSTAAPSSSTPSPTRTAGIEVVEAVIRRDNRRELDERIRHRR